MLSVLSHSPLHLLHLLQILNTMKVPYETINILEDESLRHGMKAYSQWPTFPQVPHFEVSYQYTNTCFTANSSLLSLMVPQVYFCRYPLHCFISA